MVQSDEYILNLFYPKVDINKETFKLSKLANVYVSNHGIIKDYTHERIIEPYTQGRYLYVDIILLGPEWYYKQFSVKSLIESVYPKKYVKSNNKSRISN